MSETPRGQIKQTRREFLKSAALLSGGAVVTGAVGVAIGMATSAEAPKDTLPSKPINPPTTPIPPVPTEVTKDKIAVYVDPKAIEDLAKIWTAGRAIIEPVSTPAPSPTSTETKSAKKPTATPTPSKTKPAKDPTSTPTRDLQAEVNERNMVLYRERAEEILKFVTILGPELAKIRPRLAAMARFTDVGDIPPPLASEPIRNAPEDFTLRPSGHFESGHFGPREFFNVKHNRLTRLNAAMVLAISMAESEKDSRPYSRLNAESHLDRWDGLGNPHAGREAILGLTGQTDSQKFVYGPNSHNGVFPTEKMLYSSDLDDKLIIMLSHPVMAFRALKAIPWETKGVVDFEVVDRAGNPDWELVNHWNETDSFLQAKYRQVYTGLVKFCKDHPEFKWLVEESIV